MSLGRNILWNLGGFLWLSLLIILATPFIVRGMGLDAFGAWAVITAFTGYLTAFDLGLGNAVIRYVSAEHARGDDRALGAYLRTGITLQLLLGLLAALAFLAFSEPLATRWLQVPPDLVDEVRVSFRLASIGVFLGFAVVVFAAIPAALHRFDLLAVRTMLLMSAQYILVVVALQLGGTLRDVVLVNLGGSAIILAYLVVVSHRLLPGTSLAPGWTPGAVRELLRFGRGKFPAQLAVTVLQQADRVALGALAPVSQVSFYAVPLRAAQRLGTIVEQIASPFYPAVTSHLTARRTDALRAQYRIGVRLVAVTAAGAVAVLGALAGSILTVWMGAEFATEGTTAFRVLLLAYAASACYTLPSVAADAAARPGINAIWLGAGSALHLGLLVWWIPRFGLAGGAGAVLAGFLVPVLFGIPAIHRAVPDLPPLRDVLSEARGPALAALVAGVSAALVARSAWPASGVGPLLASLLGASGVYLAALVALRAIRPADVRRFADHLRRGAEEAGS